MTIPAHFRHGRRFWGILLAVVLAGGIVFLLLRRSGKSSAHYTITDLGVLPGENASTATALNNEAQVIGYSYSTTASGGYHAFVSDGRTMTDLGVLPGEVNSSAKAINDKGQIVGESIGRFGASHAFVYANGKMQNIGTLPEGTESTAFAITPAGQILGMSENSRSIRHEFVVQHGKMTDLGLLSREIVVASNATGEIKVCALFGIDTSQEFISQKGKVTWLEPLKGGFDPEAYGINNKGQIVGSSTVERPEPFGFEFDGAHHLVHKSYKEVHAVVFVPGSAYPTDLGLLGGTWSVANAINDAGQIVGSAKTSHGSQHAAFFHIDSTTPIDLNALISERDQSQWTLITTTGINSKGQICGDGTINGQHHAFLLTPIPEGR